MTDLNQWAEGDIIMLGFAIVFFTLAFTTAVATALMIFERHLDWKFKLMFIPFTLGMGVFTTAMGMDSLIQYLGGA